MITENLENLETLETLQEVVQRHYDIIIKAIRMDRRYLEHCKEEESRNKYAKRLKWSLRRKNYYLTFYGDMIKQ